LASPSHPAIDARLIAQPTEFCEDVVRVGCARETGVSLAQVANDFGIHGMTLNKWLCKADNDEMSTPGSSTADDADLRDLKRRNRLLEQENEVPGRAVQTAAS